MEKDLKGFSYFQNECLENVLKFEPISPGFFRTKRGELISVIKRSLSSEVDVLYLEVSNGEKITYKYLLDRGNECKTIML